MSSLQELCITHILNNSTHFDNLTSFLPKHLVQYIYFRKHKRLMSDTLNYFIKINKVMNDNLNISNNRDLSIYQITYLVGTDFYSHNHLLVKFKTDNSKNFVYNFIQM